MKNNKKQIWWIVGILLLVILMQGKKTATTCYGGGGEIVACPPEPNFFDSLFHIPTTGLIFILGSFFGGILLLMNKDYKIMGVILLIISVGLYLFVQSFGSLG